MATRYVGKDYYEPKARYGHCTEIIERKLYCWGGGQKDLPIVHESEEKRLSLSVIEILDIETGLWSQQNTSGHPPIGVSGYSSCTIRNNIYYFGGWCGHDYCRHNSLSSLNVENLVLYTTSEHESAPVKKFYSGMISFRTEKNEESLLVVGGCFRGYFVGSPTYKQTGAQYTDDRTNESHIFNITTGKWITPNVTGRRPPPCYEFTLLSLSGSRALLYGGRTPDALYSDVIYIATITGYELNWEIIHKPVGEYPVGRYEHASTVISGCVQEIMITIGGLGNGLNTLNDCWVMDVKHNKHQKIHLPDNVTKRYAHSLSSLAISPTNVLLVVFGGNRSIASNPISDTHVIELVYTNDEWLVEHVWDMTQLTTNNDDYQRRLKEIQKEGQVLNMIKRSGHLALSSGEQEEEVIQLREEIRFLKIQLEASRKETTQTRREAISHQQEMRRSNTRLQEVQFQLQESQVQTQEVQVQLQETQVQLQETQVHFQETQAQLQETQVQTQQISQDKQELQTRVQELQEENRHFRAEFENPHWVIQKEEVQMTQEILGTGGWGEVKVGIFRGTKVAVKCLYQVILSEYNLGLFSREMNIASRIRHPNLLQFIGATRVGNPMILTELMPTSLRKELEKTPLTRPQILNIGHGVASALNYLHLWKPHPILHRDVSSANVLLERSGSGQWKGKLSDYGSANLLQDVRTVAPGSPAYAAPEAQFPNLHSPKMDVYSFGILFAEMVTRRLPSAIVFERRQQIRSIQWPSIKSLVERCTTQDPQTRPTIEQVLQDINTL